MGRTVRRVTYFAGFIGTAIIALGTLVTALVYTGPEDERYSLFNHFVSELGHTVYSELATLFNITLIIASLCLGIYMVGVTFRFRGWLRWVLALDAVMVGLFGLLVGMFPMDVSSTHFIVSAVSFIASFLYVGAFSLSIWRTNQNTFPRWLAFAGVPMILSALVFLVAGLVSIILGPNALAQAPSTRGDFLLVTTAEWLVIITLIVWVLVVSIYLLSSQEAEGMTTEVPTSAKDTEKVESSLASATEIESMG